MTRLLFVSPRYLLPADMGGKIRTAQVLKGLKGGRFSVTLASPAPPRRPKDHEAALMELCDEFVSWPEVERGPWFAATRLRHLFSPLPVSVATDRSAPAQDVIAAALTRTDVVVADFLHAGVLIPQGVSIPKVLFTHNVEAEIFARHMKVAGGRLRKMIWRNQLAKMTRFERQTLRRFDAVVAVSERDRDRFLNDYRVKASVIPTGVDLDYFFYHPVLENSGPPVLAFTASMDSLANIDGVRWFMDEVWPLIVKGLSNAQVRIIGRNPDASLVAEARRRKLAWTFTGTVDDVRPHLEQACVYVIPLRVGGGTRIKAYEAMAFGLPVVSTGVGIEGLKLTAERYFLQGDDAESFAAAVIRLVRAPALRQRMAKDARALMERNFSAKAVGEAFEAICVAAMAARDNVNGSLARTPTRGTSAA